MLEELFCRVRANISLDRFSYVAHWRQTTPPPISAFFELKHLVVSPVDNI